MQHEEEVNISLTLSETDITPTAADDHDDKLRRMRAENEKNSGEKVRDEPISLSLETAHESVGGNEPSSLESDGNVRRKMWKTKAVATAHAPSSSSATPSSEKIDGASSSTHNNQSGDKQSEKGNTTNFLPDEGANNNANTTEGAAISCKTDDKENSAERSCQREDRKEEKEEEREANQVPSKEEKTEQVVAAEEHLANETNTPSQDPKPEPETHTCPSPATTRGIPRVDTTASFDLCETTNSSIIGISALTSPTTYTSGGAPNGPTGAQRSAPKDNNKNTTNAASEKNGEFSISGFPFISDVRYNPQKKDKYKVKDEYEDLAEGIHIPHQPSCHGRAAASSSEQNDKDNDKESGGLNPKKDCGVGNDNEKKQRPPAIQQNSHSTSTSAADNRQHQQQQHVVEVPSSPRGAHNACGGACGGLKSQLMSPNHLNPTATHHTNTTTAGGASSSTAGTSSVVSEDFTIQIAKTRQEGKEARKAHQSNHHNDPHLDKQSSSSNHDEQQRDRSVIVTDKRAVGADVDATRSSSIPPQAGTSDKTRGSICSNNATENGKREESVVSSSAVLGPNSEPAQPQLFVSLCNPNSLLGDYIPLPEDSIVPLAFRVVKKHHRMSWLKQSRIIIVTGSDLRNCKEDGAGGSSDTGKPKSGANEDVRIDKISKNNADNSLLATIDASATKIIPFSSITRLSLTSKTSFAIHVLGDHTYYYISDHSLEIVWAIRKRMSICAAIAKLVRGTTAGTDQLRQLARAFMVDELTLPQFSAGADFFATGGSHDEFKESSKKSGNDKKSRSASGLDSVFTNDKAAAEALRYATNMKNRMAIIDAIKNEILPNEGRRLKKLIDACSSANVLQRQSISLRHIRSVIDEVRDSISELLTNPDARTKQQSKALPDIYDVSAARAVSDEAIQTVLLTAIHGNIWASLHLQHDLVEIESQFRQQCRFLRSEVAPQELGVPDSCLNFHYDLVLETIRKIATAKTPHVMMEEITACCKSIVLTITAGTEYGFTRADLPIPPVLFPSELTSGVDGGNNINSAKKKRTTLAADDILPILIYLIIYSNVNDLVYVREYVNNLGDPEEASERSYYYTMFASAIEYVLASTEEVKRMREHNAKQEEKEERRRKRREEAKKKEKGPEEEAKNHGNEKERAAKSEQKEDEFQDNSSSKNNKDNAEGNDDEEEAKEESGEVNAVHRRKKSLFEDNVVTDRSDDEELNESDDKNLNKPRRPSSSPNEKDNSSMSSQHLVLSRGGSKGRFKTVSCSESFGKVVVDPTPISEIIAKMEEKEAERQRILSSLASDAVGAAILGIKEDDDDKNNRTSSVKNDSNLGSYTRGSNHMEGARSLSTENLKSSFSSSPLTSSTPFSSSDNIGNSPAQRDQNEPIATFLSPFSAFVQNDVTLHFKRQALIRHQNNTNYNKKATSASSPYAIHNLLKNNPANIDLLLFDRYRNNNNKNSAQQQENNNNEKNSVDVKDSQNSGGPEERGNNKPYFLQR